MQNAAKPDVSLHQGGSGGSPHVLAERRNYHLQSVRSGDRLCNPLLTNAQRITGCAEKLAE